MTDELLTVNQVAERCGVTAKTIRRWIQDGRLDAHFIGPSKRIRVSVAAVLEAMKVSQFVVAVRRSEGYVYAVQSLGLVKIGIAADVEARVKGLGAMSAAPVTLLFAQEFSDYQAATRVEKEMHLRFVELNHHGEWFSMTEAALEDLRSTLAVRGKAINDDRSGTTSQDARTPSLECSS